MERYHKESRKISTKLGVIFTTRILHGGRVSEYFLKRQPNRNWAKDTTDISLVKNQEQFMDTRRKKCSTLLVIREIKTTLKYYSHFTYWSELEV